MRPVADLIVRNGRLFTWSEDIPEASALAIAEGRLLAVGAPAEALGFAGPETRIIDLEGRVLLPGFTDAHAHLATTGSRRDHLELGSAGSLSELQSLVRDAARKKPSGSWLLGRGWDESRWDPPRYPTRTDLDAPAPQHPVALSRIDGHMAVVNSAALATLSSSTRQRAERDAAGRPTGLLREEAADAVWEELKPTLPGVVEGIRTMTAEAHRLGITAIHDTVNRREIQAYLRLYEAGELPLRVNLMPRVEDLSSLTAEEAVSGADRLRHGPAKVFLDGTLGSRTAALSQPFADAVENEGTLMGPGELARIVRRATRGGYQLALHAIGDRAIDLALQGLARTPGGRRDRIEHFELPTEEHLHAAKRLGVVASMQPNFVGQWGLSGGMYEQRLGSPRVRGNNPFRLIWDEGIPLVFGSDHMPFSPLYGVHWAVNAPEETQRLTVEEALRAYSHTAAYAAFQEDRAGVLEPGRVADLVVLAKDPREEPEHIDAIPVQMTVFEGRVVYEAG